MMPQSLFRRCVILRVLLSLPLLVAGNPPTDPFAGWPSGWVATYQRFEKYNQSIAQHFPRADLEISPSGQPLHSVKLFTSTTEHLGFEFYRNGSRILSRADSKTSFSEISGTFLPDTYAVVMKSCGSLGYQYLYPITWFKTEYSETSKWSGDKNQLVFTMIKAPDVPEDFWPNERMLKYLDFHVFPKENPRELLQKNSKVEPSISLSVTISGTIVREELTPELEKLLQWRVYHDGQLINKSFAANITRLNIAEKMGDYLVFVGIVGPSGFMPVSNLLHFPLFPKKPEGFEVFPSINPTTRLPLLFEDCLPENVRQEILEAAQTKSGGGWGYYNRAAIYWLSAGYRTGDPEKDRILKLWSPWSFTLNGLQFNPNRYISEINIASETME